MASLDISRAWKDEKYRLSLSEAERTRLAAHSAGLSELAEGDLADVGGGVHVTLFYTPPYYLRCYFDEFDELADCTREEECGLDLGGGVIVSGGGCPQP